MIVSGESKIRQSHKRNRLRVGYAEAQPSSCGPVLQNHQPMSNPIWSKATTPVVVVDDEDDDVVVSSPAAFAHAKLKASIRVTRPRLPVEEDPLALRLGRGETSLCIIGNPSPSGASQQQPRSGRRGRQLRSIIDLANTLTPVRQTSMSEDCVLLSDIPKTRKRRHVQLESTWEIPPNLPAQDKEEEPKLKCPICADVMKAETSTICGHIFCQACIQSAIKAQKKCPTCRKKLTLKSIHRIYI
ncbi:uncharacterized protein [Physcomitrium patens]|uniref:RING-type domain-containing protein n=1 Tax=Physcomitrium patens TaxID=3218 RepID=A0A2K1IN43_PHYPA|nr:uncharacterized protein LOC112275166 isoform X1 [Physcomitrium patens]PNR30690.1 hypothetical protein PHYPA_027006 [Physcomitrium patens]|eukprot:XP_024361041.1 uncharacterized protein LOC112275166 isoform X1 [Physcomitrella patens]